MHTMINRYYTKKKMDRQTIDFFIPDRVKTDLILLFIHGGGFYAGAKEAFHAVADRFSSMGITSACMNYRLSPEPESDGSWEPRVQGDFFPCQVEDVRACMSYVKTHSQTYGYNPNRVIVIGSSAGAYLCAMLSTIDPTDLLGYTHDVEELDTRPYAACYYNPVVDLFYNDISMYKRPSFFCQSLMNKPVEANEELYRLASPLHRIPKTQAPVLILHAENDDLISRHAIDSYATHVKAYGIQISVRVIGKAGHGFGYGITTPQQKQALQYIDTFLQRFD